MAAPRSVWAIDIGKRALKALKLRVVEGQLQVDAFDIIEHPRIITQGDPESQQIIHSALLQFVARNNVAGSAVALAVPGQNSFTRFVPLPPVERKKIPDIVRFEAEQQIPFAIDDVVWQWQTFEAPDSPDVEVGIFAMKRTDIDEAVSHLSDVGLKVDIVQMAPLSLYNFMRFDEQLAPDGATLLADVGTDKTDIVINDGSRIWTRTIQIGGNNFTESLVKTFKLSFAKAEKLKRTAATSKYARQIFQAMRPVFAELVQEIQRSVGYYTSLHRETRFKKLIGLGNGFRLPGLQKFLEQNLNMPVVRIDTYNRLRPSEAVNAPAFTENVLSFAVAYGLALQGLELTDVNTNLLPGAIAHQRLWTKKRPWFAAAAACILISLAFFVFRAHADRGILAKSTGADQAMVIVKGQEGLNKEVDQLKAAENSGNEQIKQRMNVLAYRGYWPDALGLLFDSLNAAFSDQRAALKYAHWRSLDKELRDKIANRDPGTIGKVSKYAQYLSIDESIRNKIADKDLDAIRKLPDRYVANELMRLLGARDREELGAVVGQIREFEASLGPRNLAALMNLLVGVQDADQLVAIVNKQIRLLEEAPHGKRKIAFIEDLETQYFDDVKDAVASVRNIGKTAADIQRLQPSQTGGGASQERPARAFAVVMTVRTPLTITEANDILNRILRAETMERSRAVPGLKVAEFLPVVVGPAGTKPGASRPTVAGTTGTIMEEFSIGPRRGGVPEAPAEGGPKMPDPLFEGEDMSTDMYFKIGWVLTVEDS